MPRHVDIVSTMIFATLVHDNFPEEINFIKKDTFGGVSDDILAFT